jgi:hypothetical protein
VAGAEETIRFRKQLLMVSPNEGCAIADVDRDGKRDVIAGTHWFAGPAFAPRPLRDIDEFDNDFLRNNGDHVWDVNGDGWLDVVSGEWMAGKIFWYENPRAEALKKGLKWPAHLLATTRGENEGYFLRDMDGDSKPEIVVNCWIEDAPMVAWKLVNGNDGRWGLARVEIGPSGNGHGLAFGDVNGDGREDILCKVGWYEMPEDRALGQTWKLHRDWSLGDGSVPFVVTDVNRDGHNDLVWGFGHDFGLFWYEQLSPSSDGKTLWKEHLIDRSYSQAHCLHLADLDGDGRDELITGKRLRGHPVGDPGGNEPECLYYYTWDPKAPKFTRHTISENEGIGTGMQICTADLNEDGRTDIAVGGKSGTWVLLNLGS